MKSIYNAVRTARVMLCMIAVAGLAACQTNEETSKPKAAAPEASKPMVVGSGGTGMAYPTGERTIVEVVLSNSLTDCAGIAEGSRSSPSC